MKAVVLFEGAGGATRGLHDAGYTTIGFDHWQPAVTCAQANGYDARLHDLSDPTGDHLVPYAPLWWASPPCQPFSAAGDGEGEFDDRDGFPWLLRLTALRLPDVLLIENVKGLTFRKHSAYFCAVLEGFRALGYEVDWRVLCAADYGVPQTRERCIIACRRDGGPITWPMPTHTETPGMFTAPWVTMAQALGWNDNDALEYFTRGAGMIERHGERPPSRATLPAPTVHANFYKDMRRIKLGDHDGDALSLTERAVGLTDVAPGSILENPEHIIEQLGGIAGGSEGDEESMSGHSHHLHQPANSVKPQFLLNPGATPTQPNRRLYTPDEPAPTVAFGNDAANWAWVRPATAIAGDNRVFQPGGHHEPGEQSQNAIRLTTEELAALQGFPADWTWTGNKTQQARMIGNACPAALTEAIAAVNKPLTRKAAA